MMPPYSVTSTSRGPALGHRRELLGQCEEFGRPLSLLGQQADGQQGY